MRWSRAYLTRLVQLLQYALQSRVLLAVEVELAELRVRLEPQPVVLRLLQRLQRRLVEVLQQLHLAVETRNIVGRSRAFRTRTDCRKKRSRRFDGEINATAVRQAQFK